ncbi:MAG: hypothetical protein V3T01_08390 [Myxococcota bacterium]
MQQLAVKIGIRMLVLALLPCLVAASPPEASSPAVRRPAILFCAPSPDPVNMAWVDLSYLSELRRSGFDVDFTRGLGELTWERIRQYNVLVVFRTPDANAVQRGAPSSPARVEAFRDLMERFLAGGGGILLMPREGNYIKQSLVDLTEPWGARLPVERIVEEDPKNLATMTRIPDVPVAYTEQISASPITRGVRGIWFPIKPIHHGHMTGPIEVDENWQVAVRGSISSRSLASDLSKQVNPPPLAEPFQRPEGVERPPWVALRSRKSGRIVLINQWNQFSFGAGTKWLYDREILSRGFEGRPSDFGRLLANAFQWLAQPSLDSGDLGGYRMPPDRLTPPNRRLGARKDFDAPIRRAAHDRSRASWKLYRGLFGARTAYSSGTGSVRDYAVAAREVGLDFLVFFEDFDRLTQAEFEQLRIDCATESDETLELIPGFSIVSNIGNRVFHFGPEADWLPPDVLTGSEKSILYLQEQGADGNFTGRMTRYHRWVLKFYGNWKRGGNVGYYDFAGSGKGMQPPDLRNYSLLGLRTYREGKLVEDVTSQYLTTALSTIPPGPVSVNEVRSPQELRREVTSGNALTFALAPRIGEISRSSLRWATQYHSLDLFVSDGPMIRAWPRTQRVMTFGGENFSSLWNAMRARAWVTSDVGLAEVAIYNGSELFRRFLLHGEKQFDETLLLDATVQRNLILIAKDVKGGSAVSFARRSWKSGTGIVFCSDHINDCSDYSNATTVTMLHGPHRLPLGATPGLPTDLRGGTWDGGPTGTLPPVRIDSTPVLDAEEGYEHGGRFNQTPILEFTDEGARAVASIHEQLFDERVDRVLNGWNTRGPLGGPSKLFRYTQRFRHWFRPSLGAPETGWAAMSVRVGVIPTLYRNEIVFRQDLTLRSLRLGLSRNSGLGLEPILAVGDEWKSSTVSLVAANGKKAPSPIRIGTGEWFGFYAPGASNSHLYVNRGDPVSLVVRNETVLIFADPFAKPSATRTGRRLKRDDEFLFEVLSLGFPLDVEVESPSDFRRVLDYLERPTGLQVLRGRLIESPGMLDLATNDRAVEVILTKPPVGIDLVVPLRVRGLNRRWSAGVYQKRGYVAGAYGKGENRYRAAGVDFAGDAYIPLHPSRADRVHLVAGHPVVADLNGGELFIQVTKVAEAPFRWHVSVNNPTDRSIDTILRRAIALPGLELPATRMRFEPGEYRVLLSGAAP